MEITLNAPNQVLIVETSSVWARPGENFPIIKRKVGTTVKVKDSEYVTHSFYATSAAAWTYVQANFTGVTASQVFGNLSSLAEVENNISDSDISASVGDAVTINCDVSTTNGNITITRKWFKDDQEIAGAIGTSISTTSLTEDHYGVYTCSLIFEEGTYNRTSGLEYTFTVSPPIPALTASTAIGA